MLGWHHQLNGHEFEQTPGDSEGWEAWNVAVHGFPYQVTHAVLSLRKKKTKQMENTVLGSKNP